MLEAVKGSLRKLKKPPEEKFSFEYDPQQVKILPVGVGLYVDGKAVFV